MSTGQRVPPHSIEAEQSVLGSMLLDANAVMLAMETLTESDFYSPGHQKIFAAMADLNSDGQAVDLTAKEFDLMELLMRNPGRVYSRENLLNVVWGYEYAGDYRTVDVHVRRLREKLELDPANPEYILTKWGVGYYLKHG